MKKARKLIPAIAMLLMSAVMLTTSSYAWFSMNATVDVSGMKVEAKSTGSILISTDYAAKTYGTAVSFTAEQSGQVLIPCTYTSANKLQYVTNTQDIDPNTGLPIKDAGANKNEARNLTYADAAAWAKSGEVHSGHYIDYIVYIKAEGSALNLSQLNATVNFGTCTLGQKATTVDFLLISTAAAGEPTGYTVTHTYTTSEYKEDKVVELGALNMVDGSIYTIVMRVYVDGAATTTDGSKAFVNSTDGPVAPVSISVSFNGVGANNA